MSKTKLTIPTTGNREHKGKVRLTAPRQEKKNKARPDIGSPRDLYASCVVSAVFCKSIIQRHIVRSRLSGMRVV